MVSSKPSSSWRASIMPWSAGVLVLLLSFDRHGHGGGVLAKTPTHHPFGVIQSSVLVELRGGAASPSPKQSGSRKAPAASTVANHHHVEELMSSPTAIANVLADLCPHGTSIQTCIVSHFLRIQPTLFYDCFFTSSQACYPLLLAWPPPVEPAPFWRLVSF